MNVCRLTSADRKKYEDFLGKQKFVPIQQTPAWADFQKSIGFKSEIIVVCEANQIISAVQIFEKKIARKFTWLHVPRGPLGQQNKFDLLLEGIENFAKLRSAIFVRFDFQKDLTIKNKKLKKSHTTNFPETTLTLDLTKSEEELLAEMKPKGRYNIRVANKHGVTVRETRDITTAETFFKLLSKTTARDGFSGHDLNFYEKFLEKLGSNKTASCFLAEKDGQPLAAALVTFFGDTATYYYGASDHATRQMMAPYAIQWSAIQTARKRGCKIYDFLGIAPDDSEDHPLAGVTSFKKKFGGDLISYPESQELILRPIVFYLIKALKKIRKIFS